MAWLGSAVREPQEAGHLSFSLKLRNVKHRRPTNLTSSLLSVIAMVFQLSNAVIKIQKSQIKTKEK